MGIYTNRSLIVKRVLTAPTAPIAPIEKELIMITLQLTFNNEAEYALFDTLFEKFKIKKKVVSVEKPLNTYSETTAQKIKKARSQKQKGTLTTVTPDNLWTLTN